MDIFFTRSLHDWEVDLVSSFFETLYSVRVRQSSFKEASIADNVERSNGTIQWNIQFSRLIHDWEVEELALFYSCLYACKLRGDGKDKLWWLPSRKGIFRGQVFL